MDLDKAIKSRESVRKYNDKKPDWRDILECIDSSRYAPMAAGHFSLKFILLNDRGKIAKLAEASQQDFFSDVKYVVVVCSIPLKIIKEFGERGEIYSRQEVGAAVENFLLKLVEKELSTCWVGHFVESQVKKVLNIPEDVRVEAFFPIGYSNEKKVKKRKRIELDDVLYFERYGNKKMREPPRFGA